MRHAPINHLIRNPRICNEIPCRLEARLVYSIYRLLGTRALERVNKALTSNANQFTEFNTKNGWYISPSFRDYTIEKKSYPPIIEVKKLPTNYNLASFYSSRPNNIIFL